MARAAVRASPFPWSSVLMCFIPAEPPMKAAIRTNATHPQIAFLRWCALHTMMQLPPEELARGVAAGSAGTHAQALAFAAGKLGTRAVVFMPEDAPLAKVAAARQYGAEVRLGGASFVEAHQAAEAAAA